MGAMKSLSTKSLKLAFLAATAGVVASAADAAPAASPAAPTYAEAVITPAPSNTAPETTAVAAAVKTAGLAALFAGAVAFAVRLIGRKRIDAAAAFVGPHVARVVHAATETVRSAGRAVAAPIRATLITLGLLVFALTGIDILNIEWTAGIVVGACLVLAAFARPLRLNPLRRRSG